MLHSVYQNKSLFVFLSAFLFSFLILSCKDEGTPSIELPEGYQQDIPWPSLANSWSIHRGDAQFTGRSKFAGPQAGEIEWKIKIPTLGNSTNTFLSPILGSDSTIYFISFYEPTEPGSFIYAVDSKGNLKWKKSIGTFYKLTAPPIINSDGVIYLADWKKNLFALSVNDEIKWQVELQSSVYGKMNLGLDGTLYALTSFGNLVAVSKNGSLLYDIPINDIFSRWSSIVFVPDGSAFYVVEKNILALITTDGTLQWKKNLDNQLSCTTPIVDSYGNIFIYNHIDTSLCGILSFDKNGNERFRFFNPQLSVEIDMTMDKEGNLYCGGANKIFSIDTYGKLRWSKTDSVDSRSSGIVCDKNGNIFFVSSEKKLVKMDKSGNTLWEVAVDGYFYESPALSRDGKIFLGSADGKKYFYCIK